MGRRLFRRPFFMEGGLFMFGFTSALNKASLNIGMALMKLPKYIIHDDGTYEIVEEAIETYAAEPISNYASLPARFQYTIPWDIDILYEGINMLTDMLKNAVPVAFWIFLILTGVHLVFNLIRSLSS